MSRKAKYPIEIPAGVDVHIEPGKVVVKGPNGQDEMNLAREIDLKLESGQLHVSSVGLRNGKRARLGLTHALIANMVEGVSKGFDKVLQFIGVGYRARLQGKKLNVQVGHSHPVSIDIPEGLTVKIEEKDTKVTVSGANKELVGQFSAEVRSIRPPEPYKGKGIRYADEYVRRKAGKAAAKG